MATPRRSRAAQPAARPGLNLNTARLNRAKMRAARRAEQGKDVAETLPIYFGPDDALIAELGSEFALDTLSPIIDMLEEVDLQAIVVNLWEAIQQEASEEENGEGAEDGEEADERTTMAEAIVRILVTSPTLPVDLVKAALQTGEKLLGEAGFAAFVAERPSREDVQALASGIMDWYGLSLGELVRSLPTSPDDGGTSSPTSPTTTQEKTSAESGGDPATPDSSASPA